MALYDAQFEPSGSLFGATFVSPSEGRRAHIRQKSSLDRDKWLRAKAFEGARKAATEFGGASSLAARIYRELGPIAELCKAYTHNHLAQVLRQAALTAKVTRPHQGRHRIPAFQSTQMAAALQGLQLGRAGKKPRSFPRHQKRQTQGHNLPPAPMNCDASSSSPSPLGRDAGQASMSCWDGVKENEGNPSPSPSGRDADQASMSCWDGAGDGPMAKENEGNPSPSPSEERRTRKASVNSLEQTIVNNCRRDEPEYGVLPNGDLIQITGTNGRYAVHGLKAQQAQMPDLQPNQRRLFKIHLAWSAVPEMELPEVLLKQNVNMPKYEVQQIPHHAEGQYLGSSDWINPDHLEDDLLPLGAIQFPELPDAPDGLPIITFVAIEWREYQGLRPKNLESCSTVTVAELLEYRDGKVIHLDHKFRRRALRPRRPRAVNRPALREPLTPTERIKRALARIPLRE